MISLTTSEPTPALSDAAPATAPALGRGRGRSRAALNLPGLCPLCGHEAARKVVHQGGSTIEAYRCPVDGEVAYRSGAMVEIGFDGRAADMARLVATRPGAAAHFVGMGTVSAAGA